MLNTTAAPTAATFLDMQAQVGITKHPGGYTATNELLALCRVEQAQLVLNVGCGIGVASVHVAKHYTAHVVGIDYSAQMVAWSRQRAREEHVTDRVEFHIADVLALPFPANCFDLVFCESVLNFVDDKRRAIAECVRVTRPGGYAGINEMFWTTTPNPDCEPQVRALLGTAQALPTAAAWQAIWDASGLQDRAVSIRQIDPRREVRDRLQWVGWRWIARAWGRALRLYVTNPAVRQAIKEQFDFPMDVMQQMGYGLFVGRK